MRFNYKGVLLMLAALLYFYFLVGGIETFLNGNPEATAAWKADQKEAFYFNILIVFSLFLLLMGIFNRYMVSFILTNIVVVLLAVISYYKFSFLGEYLYPWDMLLYNNIFNLLPNLYKEIDSAKLLGGAAIVIAIISGIVAYAFIKKPKRLIRLNPWLRVAFIGAAAAFLSIFIFYRSIPNVEASLKEVGVTNLTFDQIRNYKTNGFLVTFLLNMQSAIVLSPSGYNEKNINEIVDDLERVPPKVKPDLEKKPNIIFVMSESFWDPTSMENLTFGTDPVPNVREHQTGKILSPTFGGGTSNVEFEVLTGFSNMFLPPGSVPYQQYIKDELPSMPRYLAEMGYQTTAIHPYPKWFWNREEVYKHIGFDKFIDIDGFTDPLYKGPFVSDEQVTNTIIEQTEQSEDPVFAYAITMQNHTGYNEDKYPEYTVETGVPETVDPVFNLLLRSYTQGVSDADKAFKQLIDYYENAEEPTLVVFFGDHLPAIGQDYKFYKQADFVARGPGEENWDLEDYQDTRTTPLVIWNNYGAPTPEIETVSTSFLGPTVFDMAGIQKPLYYSILEQFSEQMPGYTRDLKIDAEGNLLNVTPDAVERIKQDYQLIQYDLLFGKQYSRDALFKP